jgi:hypothetical protein
MVGALHIWPYTTNHYIPRLGRVTRLHLGQLFRLYAIKLLLASIMFPLVRYKKDRSVQVDN